ncbi:MAG: hypothetical protein L6428_03900 [Candidatus Aminicenantes bacterium]|nr:hypothetical protein [Acidobacteriota bacterium]MCG2810589.1 hypothetical protein [Candidatus Aminicenantes bacterium]
MIKKQQKWIALLVTLTFMWLLQVSTMPVAAASTTEQIGSANAEKAPSFIEEEGDSSYQPRKKSALPLILGVVAVGALAAVLFLVVLKTKYDITGIWTITVSWINPVITGSFDATFTGDKKSGTSSSGSNSGVYSVSGKDATFNFGSGSYTGIFNSKTTMSGTMHNNSGNSGTFTATKKPSSTAGLIKNDDLVTGEKTTK